MFDLTLSVLQCVVKAIASSKIYNAHVLVVCGSFVLGLCFVVQYLCLFKFYNHLTGKERAGCFYFGNLLDFV